MVRPTQNAASLEHPFKIGALKVPQGGDPDQWLPKSQTCFFTLKLPHYTSLEVTRQKLTTAIEMCSTMDADVLLHADEVAW